jgi:catechol-2,3-dioxygenase
VAAIANLGHVGIHVRDLERAKAFYRDLLGLTVTDEDPERGMVFLSACPDEEHHELLLVGGRDTPDGTIHLQQIAFRCDSLEDVIGYAERFAEHDVSLDMVVSHGNAVGIYFFDPELNRCEVYWRTGLPARQPYLESIDLTQSPEEIRRRVEASVAVHGEEGYMDDSLLASQNLASE